MTDLLRALQAAIDAAKEQRKATPPEERCDMCHRPTHDGSALCFTCAEDILDQLSDWENSE